RPSAAGRRRGEARRVVRRGVPPRVPHHLAGRDPHETDHDAFPESHGDGRGGVPARLPARRRRAPLRLRQDDAGHAHGRRLGRRAVEMALAGGPKPSEILTAQAFDNAIRADMAIGGSTNAIIHLVAIAGRVGVPLPLARFDELARTTPFLANLRPSGKYLMEDF